MTRSALITGIHGQDAFYLSNLLRRKNYKVLGLTRFEINRETKQIQEGLEIRETDYSYHDIRQIVEQDFSIIFHLAGQSWVSKSWENVDETIASQALITTKFLKILSERKSRDTHFVQAASSEIFCSDEKNAINEHSRVQPVNPYGCAKAFAFHMVNMYREKYELKASNAILFPHESVRRPREFAVRKIISGLHEIATGKIANIRLGKIDVVRDWGYAPEFADALFLIGESSNPTNYCVCTSHAMSLANVLHIALDYFDLPFEGTVILDESLVRYFDYRLVTGDPTKIRTELNWEAQVFGPKLVTQLIQDELNSNDWRD